MFGIYAISSMHSSAAFLPVQSMCVFSLVFTSSTAQAAFKIVQEWLGSLNCVSVMHAWLAIV